MSLTPEQFQKLALKEDVEEIKNTVNILAENMEKLTSSIDAVLRRYNDHKTEHDANLGAHQVMQKQINECREKLGLKITREV